jgi:hypothetical protein
MPLKHRIKQIYYCEVLIHMNTNGCNGCVSPINNGCGCGNNGMYAWYWILILIIIVCGFGYLVQLRQWLLLNYRYNAQCT